MKASSSTVATLQTKKKRAPKVKANTADVNAAQPASNIATKQRSAQKSADLVSTQTHTHKHTENRPGIRGSRASPPVEHRFQPGVSGNPSGVPKTTVELKRLAREKTPQAIETLNKIMMDEKAPHMSRVQAATAILDRGHGKAVQQVEVGGPGAFAELSDDEVSALIIMAAATLKAPTKPTGTLIEHKADE